jgi:Response regulator containing a CheY-like receiver domain and a GGDEF domain
MTLRTPNDRKPIILIVDDTPINLKVLFEYLGDQNYEILVAEDGESAIEQAEISSPDLILLDVMLPGIDGFETCARLKALESTREVPIIFMTALSDTQYIVQAFELGAADYLTKPLRHEEVSVRVKNHIALHRLQRKLQGKIEQCRPAEPALREINAGQDQHLSMLASELKSPLHQILITSENLCAVAASATREEIQVLAKQINDSSKSIWHLLLRLLD